MSQKYYQFEVVNGYLPDEDDLEPVEKEYVSQRGGSGYQLLLNSQHQFQHWETLKSWLETNIQEIDQHSPKPVDRTYRMNDHSKRGASFKFTTSSSDKILSILDTLINFTKETKIKVLFYSGLYCCRVVKWIITVSEKTEQTHSLGDKGKK